MDLGRSILVFSSAFRAETSQNQLSYAKGSTQSHWHPVKSMISLSAGVQNRPDPITSRFDPAPFQSVRYGTPRHEITQVRFETDQEKVE